MLYNKFFTVMMNFYLEIFKETRVCLTIYLLSTKCLKETRHISIRILDGSTDFPTRVNAVGGSK